MPGPVVMGGLDVINVTLSLDTSAYASADVLADTQEVAYFFNNIVSGKARIESILILDEDHQAQSLDLVFLDANVSLGTENSAVSITDAHARNIVGLVKFLTTDYTDLVASQIAVKTGIDLIIKNNSNASLWIAAICRSGTPTYTASGLKLKIGYSTL